MTGEPRLLFFTDGLLEASDRAGRFFRIDQQTDALRRPDLQAAADELLDRLRAHTRPRLGSDVAVLLAELTFTGPGLRQPAAPGEWPAEGVTGRGRKSCSYSAARFAWAVPRCGYIRCMLPFADRRAAGLLLAERVHDAVAVDHFPERAMVLALPRGGVAVAKQVAVALGLPLDVIVTRKIGYPPQPELGVGAIAEGLTEPVYDPVLLDRLSLSASDLAPVAAAEEAELARRVRVYRGGNPLPPVAGWCVIVVDDGLATGVTARAALRSLRAARAGLLVLAVPVAPVAAAVSLRAEADQVIIVETPAKFASVGQCYASFGQLTDADVLALLA